MSLIEDVSVTIDELHHVIIPSGVARAGMPILNAVKECLQHNLPGIPFCDDSGMIVGRVSIKNLLIQNCIPADVRKHADLLSDHAQQDLSGAQHKIKQLMETPVDAYVIAPIPSVSPSSPVFKALGIIDKYNSSYIFVEQNGRYLGTMTLTHIVKTMLDIYRGEHA
jgi:CBS-domain-containing membrane protein